MNRYKINPSKTVFQVYYLDIPLEKWILYMNLEFKDMVSSTMEHFVIDPNTLDLTIKDETKYETLLAKRLETPMLLQRMIYDSTEIGFDTLETSNYNPIFFISGMSKNYQEDNLELKINALDWKFWVEGGKILDHNNENYTQADIPQDPDDPTKYVVPDDANKIKYPDLATGTVNRVNLIIDDFYQKHVGYPLSENDNYPVQLRQHLTHYPPVPPPIYDPTPPIAPTDPVPQLRRPLAFGGYLKYGTNPNITYRNTDDKQTFLEYKQKMFEFTRQNRGWAGFWDVNCKLDADGKLWVIYFPRRTQFVDRFTEQGTLLSYNISHDFSTQYNYIHAETGEEQVFYADIFNKIGEQPHIKEFTNRELLFQTEGRNYDEVIDELNGKFEENRYRQKSFFEIQFNTYDYYKDIRVNDMVELTNFGDLNGRYYIKKISEIIEGDYITYAIDEMEITEPGGTNQ